MLAQLSYRSPEFSGPSRTAAGSTPSRHGCFSSTLARLEAPITGRCKGDLEADLILLPEHNLALLETSLRHITDSSRRNNTLVSRTIVLHLIEEEEDNIPQIHLGQQYPGSYSSAPQRYWEALYQSHSFETASRESQRHSKSNEQVPVGAPLPRPLTHHSTIDIPIVTTMESTPGSPPELTQSNSSKGSSYASRLPSPDEFAGGNMNFEDMNLNDDKHTHDVQQYHHRSSNKENAQAKNHATRRPVLATLQTKPENYLRSVENGVKSAATPFTARTFISPTTQSGSSGSFSRTRSESPALHKAKSSSRLGTFAQTPASSLGIPGRRGSWQPSRKTIYEIEAEYHDSDDELPDDASLFNVPMSLFTPYVRPAARSAGSSAQGSSGRDRPSLNPLPIPLAHARTVPDTPLRKHKSSRALLRQKTTLGSSSAILNPSKSASTSPRNDAQFGRTKSWNHVMADLDHEARIIAEKLDFHSEANAEAFTTGQNPHCSSAPGAIPLPPIQRGTLDFMPMSKEKQAVLSRTRPSWLPPKNPREEKRHLEEYQRMMKASIKAETKREQALKQQQCAKDDARDSLHRIWTYYVEPTTDINAIDKRVNDLCWKGIPPKLRGQVWQRTVGNPLGVPNDGFAIAKGRVAEIKSRPAENMAHKEKRMQNWFADIERDAETAFPDLSMFRRNGPQWQNLIDLCEAYAFYRSEIGYFYGLQLVAALVLLQVPKPEEAFVLLANILNKPMPLAFQTGETAATSHAYSKVKSTLDIKFPRLHSYLFSSEDQGGLGFLGEELLEPMFRTLFANGLDLDGLCRAWDIWIFESDRYLVRTAVALLGSLEQQIFDIQGDVHLRRRNVQEMLGWGPFNRSHSGYWKLDTLGGGDSVVETIRAAGRLDCAGK